MTAWLAMIVASVARITTGSSAQSGIEKEKRVLDLLRAREHERRLSEIVQRQRGEGDEDPGELDRPAAEMTEVGVERLGAGDGEEDRAQRDQPDDAVMCKEA